MQQLASTATLHQRRVITTVPLRRNALDSVQKNALMQHIDRVIHTITELNISNSACTVTHLNNETSIVSCPLFVATIESSQLQYIQDQHSGIVSSVSLQTVAESLAQVGVHLNVVIDWDCVKKDEASNEQATKIDSAQEIPLHSSNRRCSQKLLLQLCLLFIFLIALSLYLRLFGFMKHTLDIWTTVF